MAAITQAFLSRSNALYVQESIDFHSNRMKELQVRHKGDDQLIYLSLLIEQSPSFSLFKEGPSERVAEIQADTHERQVENNLNAINQSVVGGVSEFFGDEHPGAFPQYR